MLLNHQLATLCQTLHTARLRARDARGLEVRSIRGVRIHIEIELQ